MKLYRAKKGTPAQLITREENQDVQLQDWTLRRDVELSDPLIDPIIYHNNPHLYAEDSLAAKLALKGYGVYCNADDPAGPTSAKYLIAIQYTDVYLV